MAYYEFLDHTADVLIRAYGKSLEEAFGSAAEALFALITDYAHIRPTRQVELDVESIDQEGLLVSFLSRLIVVFETDNLVLTDFSITFTSENALSVTAGAEPFDEHTHGQGTPVKGISYHMMEINEPRRGDQASVQVLFDI
jgi:SHS2 domain-containing protein